MYVSECLCVWVLVWVGVVVCVCVIQYVCTFNLFFYENVFFVVIL